MMNLIEYQKKNIIIYKLNNVKKNFYKNYKKNISDRVIC